MKDLQADPFRVFPRGTSEERADLRRSIEAMGLRNPVIMDESGNVIDGHERRDVCIELGIDWLVRAEVRIGLNEIQKKALAIDLNLWRRPVHLTRAQRISLIDIYLEANPQLSEPQVAGLFGVHQTTINRRKQELMRLHKLPLVTATVGKDGVIRKVGQRRKKDASVIVKGKKEYEALRPVLAEIGDELHGLQRRPKRLHAIARRKKALEEVNSSDVVPVPSHCRIERCDFRQLPIPDNSVDVILTDVVWSSEAEPDWVDLAALAKRWLKDDGIFCSIIGTKSLSALCQALSRHLRYQWTISLVFKEGFRSFSSNVLERWRPAVVFSKAVHSPRIDGMIDAIFESRSQEKQYHDWQQPIEVCRTLVERLTRPGDLVVDPHLGTGTNAVACSLLGNRTFIGCDIDEQQVRTARYRVAHEGKRHSA